MATREPLADTDRLDEALDTPTTRDLPPGVSPGLRRFAEDIDRLRGLRRHLVAPEGPDGAS